jgi:hypothetical protein
MVALVLAGAAACVFQPSHYLDIAANRSSPPAFIAVHEAADRIGP